MAANTRARAVVAVATLVFLASAPAGAEVRVGGRAPWFDLPALQGPRVSLASLAGEVAILVIGTTRPAAPRCKEWMLTLLPRFRVAIYQVIVIDKPWYAPRSAVLSEIRRFTGPGHDRRVLLEWYTVFADSFGIARDNDPRLVVIDRRGIVRLILRGSLTAHRLALLRETVQELLAARPLRRAAAHNP